MKHFAITSGGGKRENGERSDSGGRKENYNYDVNLGKRNSLNVQGVLLMGCFNFVLIILLFAVPFFDNYWHLSFQFSLKT